MSARKFSNFFQRSQTLIPRAPYHFHARVFLFLQRFSMLHQTPYSRLLAPLLLFPCLRRFTARRATPQAKHELDALRLAAGTIEVVPQSQSVCQCEFPSLA